MKHVIIIAAMSLIAACSGSDAGGSDTLQGVWKSDAGRTLDSMRSKGNVPANAKRVFENDFFGHLQIEYRGSQVRAWNEKDGFDMPFAEYEVVEETGDYIVTRVNDGSGDEDTKLYLDGNCYYTLVPRFSFREYFCKVGG